MSSSNRTDSIGTETTYLLERDGPLTLAHVQAQQKRGSFVASTVDVLSFGFGSAPAWIYLPVNNPGGEIVRRRLLIETSWLDVVDIYVVGAKGVVTHRQLGDTQPFNERSVQSLFFAVDWNFEPGLSGIYIRVESVDPILLPIFLLTIDQAHAREVEQSYHNGLLYGYISALLTYNFVLFISLRDRRHLYYAGFLMAFQLLNVAYTGHGFAKLWPESVTLQRWMIPLLMVMTAISGLAFAKNFLETVRILPRAHRAITWFAAIACVAVLFAELLLPNQLVALYIAFVAVTVFSVTMLWLGVVTIRLRQRYAPYFLGASIASAIGTAITALTVWGVIPFSDWKYHAVEYGTALDATLLALALGKHFRAMQRESLIAVEHAARDPLTALYNRRSFLEVAQSMWSDTERSGRPLSLVMIDLDHFKSINDTYGHGAGDATLIATANVLVREVRNGDVIARWGGEEFLLILPDTDINAAVVLAERLRSAIAEIRVPVNDTAIALTASSGVASKAQQTSLGVLITEVDNLLYQAKREGRNRVCFAQKN